MKTVLWIIGGMAVAGGGYLAWKKFSDRKSPTAKTETKPVITDIAFMTPKIVRDNFNKKILIDESPKEPVRSTSNTTTVVSDTQRTEHFQGIYGVL